jgi:hypothetical protein
VTQHPDEILRHAAWYLMGLKSIWYDKASDQHGNPIPGPHYEAVTILCRLASEIRAEAATLTMSHREAKKPLPPFLR